MTTSTHRDIIADHVALYQAGRSEDAFCGLVEFGAAAVPELIAAYGSSEDVEFRAFMVRVIAWMRTPEALEFLRLAARQEDPLVWKTALDGLVMLRAANDLEETLTATADDTKREWIVEAIEQACETGLDHDA